MQNKICFVRLSALGDCVMMLPFVRTMQKAFPNTELTWVTSKGMLPILERLEGIRFITVSKIKNLSSLLETRSVLKSERFDLLLAMQASFSANLLYPFIRARRKIGFDSRRGKDAHTLFISEKIPFNNCHILESYLDFAKYLGAQEIVYDGSIPLKEEEKEWAETIAKEPYCIFHPASSHPYRNWPIDRYIRIGLYIKKTYGLKIFVTGGPDDVDICSRIQCGIGMDAENLAGKTPLRRLSALISKARFLLAPDTGPAHIGSAFQIPVVGLYTVSPSRLSGPYFSQSFVIDKFKENMSLYQKKPTRRWDAKGYHKNSMLLVTEEDVIAKIDSIQSLIPTR